MIEQAQVSVIIPCYRCVDTIGRAVASVATQSLRPVEVILVEDCSGDNTLEALYKLQEEYGDNWIKIIPLEKNGGPGEARNSGWKVATQPLIAFLDADDSWHPQKIEIQHSWMVEHPDVVLTGHDCLQLSKDELHLPDDEFDLPSVPSHQVLKFDLLLSNRFSTPSVMLRRDIEQRFAKGKYHSEDYLLWLEIVCGGGSAYKINSPMAYLYKAAYGEEGLSAEMWKMQKGELDTYKRIRRSSCVSFIVYLFLLGWSCTRFFRRNRQLTPSCSADSLAASFCLAASH
ncbi:MAG: glycosyltransferase family 2 protein [Trichloromonadaceae bacterium]